MWLGLSPVAGAQCGCANCPISLPDNLSAVFTGAIVVYNDENDVLGVNNTLEQVCIDIDHTYVGDLDITLISPDGTSIVLFADGNNNSTLGGSETCPCGNNNDNMTICFTRPGTTNNIFGTEGAGPCTSQSYSDPCNGGDPCYTGNWGTWNEGCQGGSGLDEFNNGTGSVSGTWLMVINDNAAVDQGIVHDVSLVFSNPADSCFSFPPPPVPPCSNNTAVSIPDNTGIPAFSTISNDGSAGNMGGGTDLVQVCMLIDHTWIGDLTILLYEPDGSGVILSSSNGGSSDDYGDVSSGAPVCFSPAAANPITAYSGGQTGSWVPEGELGDFNGPANGDWNLLVFDNIGIDQGSILSWSIEFTNGQCSADCTVRTNLSAGFCAGYTYDFNGAILSSGGIYLDTIPLGNGCDSIVTLTLNEIPVIVSQVGLTICEGDSATINGLDYYHSEGSFTDTLATPDCDSVVMLDLAVEPIRYSTWSVSLCPGDSALLPGGAVADAEGTYIDTITGYWCDSIVTTNISVQLQYDTAFHYFSCDPADTGTVVEIQATQFGCDSVITTRTDLAPTDSSGYYATTCDPAEAGTATYYYPNAYGCDSLVTVITEIGPNTSSVIATTCDPQQAGTAIDTFTSSAGCDSLVTTETVLLPSHVTDIFNSTCDPGLAGFVSIREVNRYGCDSIVNITTDLLPSHAITLQEITCDLAEVGTADEIFTNSYGCDSIITTVTELADTMDVSVSPAFSSILTGSQVQFSVHPANGQIQWSPPIYLSCDTCAEVTATPDVNISYVIERRIGDCAAYDTVRVDVRQPDAYAPSAFSPNGDGVNDLFQIIPANIDQLLTFRVYNRWGELMFETDDINHGWDGTFKGEEQDVDGYIYIIEVVLYTGERVMLSDLVFLIR